MDEREEKREKLNQMVELVNDSKDGLSSIKNVTSGIVRIINDPRSTARDLKELIDVDPPLTARVLRLANSAYYSPGRRIGEISQAIIIIGFDAVKELALSQKVSEVFSQDVSVGEYSRALLWKHSIAVALLGKLIYRKEFGERGENVYAAGILHDIGIIVEDQFLQDNFKSILRKAMVEESNLSGAERDILGYTHADVGRVITMDWNFPKELSTAIGSHHRPDRARGRFERMASTLYVAEYFVANHGIGYSDASRTNESRFAGCVRKLELGAHALDLLVAEMKVELSRMESQGLLV